MYWWKLVFQIVHDILSIFALYCYKFTSSKHIIRLFLWSLHHDDGSSFNQFWNNEGYKQTRKLNQRIAWIKKFIFFWYVGHEKLSYKSFEIYIWTPNSTFRRIDIYLINFRFWFEKIFLFWVFLYILLKFLLFDISDLRMNDL